MEKYAAFYWLVLILLLLLPACKKSKCGLHEFNDVKAIKFSLDKWHGLNLKELKAEEPFSFQVARLWQREQMLCDLFAKHLIRGQYCKDFVELLGEPKDSIFQAHKTLYPSKLDSTLISQCKTAPLVYFVGENASGICYLVLFLDEKGKYLACYRAFAI